MVKVKLVQGKRFYYNGWKINRSQVKEIPPGILETFPNHFETIEEKPKRSYKKKTEKPLIEDDEYEYTE